MFHCGTFPSKRHSSHLCARFHADNAACARPMGKPWLEGFKFATYLSIPIVLTVAFAANPANLESIIRNVRGLCDCVCV